MQLDRMTARIAPRNAWQAMDLGVRLYQQWFKSLTLIWLVATVIPFSIIMWIAGADNYGWGLFVCWWLKPLWEKPLLEYSARALFDDRPKLMTLLREWPRYALKGYLPWLFFRRFDVSRSFHLPITQLEGQTGDAYRERTRTLAMGPKNHSGMLTILMAHIEQFFGYGVVALIMMLNPDQYYLSDFGELFSGNNVTLWISTLSWYLAACVCEPLYVCCGFALYLNKRTWLEGWDLELGLRKIGKKRKSVRVRLGAVLAVCCVTIGLSLMSPDVLASTSSESAHNHSGTAEPSATTTPHDLSIDIVSGPDYMPMKISQGWRLKEAFRFDSDEDNEEDDADDTSMWEKFFDWLLKTLFGADKESKAETPDGFEFPTLAESLRFILWVLAVSLLLWIILNGRKWLAKLRPTRSTLPRHTSVAGLDIRPESLPDDITQSALSALADQNPREALSLLYRATLSRLFSEHPIALTAGATETECLRALRNATSKQSNGEHAGVAYLGNITPMWISTAWAHRPPPADDIRQAAIAWQNTFNREVPAA